MKEIKAIIHPHMVHKVVHALEALEHFPGFTLLDAQGQGRGRGTGGAYVVTEEDIGYHRKSVLVVVCSGELVEAIVETIRSAAHTGHKGDGIITVGELGQVVRIRSGEKNDLAV
ncbi:MAG: P-II family nitrogen regulator [Candidatus Manganitrophaceae bacterium]|nr:MAG: P-II family nitrogen regulator [Candidatus Manganitrophaceae bacterium]